MDGPYAYLIGITCGGRGGGAGAERAGAERAGGAGGAAASRSWATEGRRKESPALCEVKLRLCLDIT